MNDRFSSRYFLIFCMEPMNVGYDAEILLLQMKKSVYNEIDN